MKPINIWMPFFDFSALTALICSCCLLRAEKPSLSISCLRPKMIWSIFTRIVLFKANYVCFSKMYSCSYCSLQAFFIALNPFY